MRGGGGGALGKGLTSAANFSARTCIDCTALVEEALTLFWAGLELGAVVEAALLALEVREAEDAAELDAWTFGTWAGACGVAGFLGAAVDFCGTDLAGKGGGPLNALFSACILSFS